MVFNRTVLIAIIVKIHFQERDITLLILLPPILIISTFFKEHFTIFQLFCLMVVLAIFVIGYFSGLFYARNTYNRGKWCLSGLSWQNTYETWSAHVLISKIAQYEKLRRIFTGIAFYFHNISIITLLCHVCERTSMASYLKKFQIVSIRILLCDFFILSSLI